MISTRTIMPAFPSHPPKPLILSGRGVTAVLGPTNTGKTHYAIERMAAHSSGARKRSRRPARGIRFAP